MESIVDGRGKSCPIPVIMTKKELENTDSNIVVSIVDNPVARENVCKLAASLNYEYKVEEISESEFHISIERGPKSFEQGQRETVKEDKFSDLSLGFSTDIMGTSNRDLGEILIKSYIYTVSETSPYPRSMVFFNTGINLTCKDSPVLEDLIKLEKEGVEIISCGTCLDYFNKKDDLGVGSISNMYTIYEKLRQVKSNIIL